MKKVNLRIRNFENECFITYNIDNEDSLDEEILDYLEEEPKGIVPIIFEEGEEFDTFSYDITDRIRLSEISNQEVSAELILNVLRSLVLTLIDMRENGIPFSYFVLNRDYMYVDSDYRVDILCIPLLELRGEVDLNAFLRGFLSTIRYNMSEDCRYVAALLTFINDVESFRLEKLVTLIEMIMNRMNVEIIEVEDEDEDEVSVEFFEDTKAENASASEVIDDEEKDFENITENASDTKENEVEDELDVEEEIRENELDEKEEIAEDAPILSEEAKDESDEFDEDEGIVEEVPDAEEEEAEVEPALDEDVEDASDEDEENAEEMLDAKEEEAEVEPILDEDVEDVSDEDEGNAEEMLGAKEDEAEMEPVLEPDVKDELDEEKVETENKADVGKDSDVEIEYEEFGKEVEPKEEKKVQAKSSFKTKAENDKSVVIDDDFEAFLAEKEKENPILNNSEIGLKIKKNIRVNRASIVRNTQEESTLERDSVQENLEERQQAQDAAEHIFDESVENILDEAVSVLVEEQEDTVSEDKSTEDNTKKEEDSMKVAISNVVNTVRNTAVPKINPYLIRNNTEERVMIMKQNFRIGKASIGVDYSVKGNGAISRLHAVISNKDGIYYIKDNKSTNHTYVGERMLEEGEVVELTHECIITLGDEEFTFKMN